MYVNDDFVVVPPSNFILWLVDWPTVCTVLLHYGCATMLCCFVLFCFVLFSRRIESPDPGDLVDFVLSPLQYSSGEKTMVEA